MTDVISTALSGLNAARARFQASANNIANANSDGARPTPDGQPGTPPAYRPVQISQSTLSGFSGVSVSTAPVNPASVSRYSPDASYADDQGLVDSPNVDYGTEMVNQISAVSSYQANVAVIRLARELDRELLDSTKPAAEDGKG